MPAPKGNTNALKKGETGIRVSACLSIGDEKKSDRRRKSWAIARIREEQKIEHPTDQEISRFVKDWCYARIDEDIAKTNF